MYKTDNGSVIASLTEVKNKTGDIFAIVDQLGEISLSSYNKIKYKIIKVDIDELIDFEDKKEKSPRPLKENHSTKKPIKAVEMETKKVEVAKEDDVWDWEDKSEEPVVEEKEESKLFDRTIKIDIWDRNDSIEKNFTDKATKPLIS